MRFLLTLLSLAVPAVIVATALWGCNGKPPAGEAVVMRACRICHGADRICAQLGTLDRAGWQELVDRMVAGGAHVTPGERSEVVDWLASRKPGAIPPCAKE